MLRDHAKDVPTASYYKLCMHNYVFLLDLQIGFVNQSYNFTEPRGRRVITDVVIMKENNVVTEQTYSVIITPSTPADPRLNAATLEPVGGGIHDYSLGNPGQTFVDSYIGPDVQSRIFNFILNGDQSPEGVESFQLTITPSEGFPTYRSPTTLFTTTLINIIDDDGKFKIISQHNIFSTNNCKPCPYYFPRVCPYNCIYYTYDFSTDF